MGKLKLRIVRALIVLCQFLKLSVDSSTLRHPISALCTENGSVLTGAIKLEWQMNENGVRHLYYPDIWTKIGARNQFEIRAIMNVTADNT